MLALLLLFGAEKNIITADEDSSWNSDQNHTAYAHSKYGAELEVWRGSHGRIKCCNCKSWGYFSR